MYKKTLKILLALVIMWIVSLLTIVKEFKFKNNNFMVLNDNQLYEHALNKLHMKINLDNESGFIVWNMIDPSNGSLTLEDKLASIKGYEFPPGMNGRPVILKDDLRGSLNIMVRRGWTNHAFNEFVSDMIPLSRTLPDLRDEWCKERNYVSILPQASVVICFHNEAWSTLLRTVHSVLKRTPDHLLKQIILFDDNSTMPHLGDRLYEYIHHLPKVTLVRAQEREGLIRARILALKYVTAPVVVYLDSHCECSIGWLEPLLNRIALDSTRVVSPVVDHIHDNTFEYISQDTNDLRIGGFNWDLRFIWKSIPRETLVSRSKKNPASPIRTPTISGGLFAINKKYFETLGYYDDGFAIWGAENLELSFKTWMCGGSLEIVPCSHVGHIFRKRFPYKGQQGSFQRNSARLAEVWIDDYAKYYYERIGNIKIDYGNVSERIALRKRLKCKSFNWYLKNVYLDMEIPDNYVASGQIYSATNYAVCLDAETNVQSIEESVKLLPCHFQGGNQYWVYTKDGEIKRDDMCLDYVLNYLTLFLCRGRTPSQVWLYNEQTYMIRHMQTQKCLRIIKTTEQEYKAVLEKCDVNVHAMKFAMVNFKLDRLSPELQGYAMRDSHKRGILVEPKDPGIRN